MSLTVSSQDYVAGPGMMLIGLGVHQREANVPSDLRPSRRLAVEHRHCATLQPIGRWGMLNFALWPIFSSELTFFLASIVKGVTGMGLPTVARGLLGAFMSPVAAAGLLILPSFVTNVWQLASGPSFTELVSRLWPMMVGIELSTVASSSVLVSNIDMWTRPYRRVHIERM